MTTSATPFVKRISFFVILLLASLCLMDCREKHTPPLPEMVDYNFDVKPILVQKCYLCHGPDSGSRKGGLRLDTFEGATAALKEGGQAITPGHPSGSKLVERINNKDPELMMPPPDTKQILSEREIKIFFSRYFKASA